MYLPRFTLTPKIASNLEQIGQVLGFFKTITIPKEFKQEYIDQVATEIIHASTAIEGNTLTKAQVGQVIMGKPVTAIKKDVQEVKNYLHILKTIGQTAENFDKYSEALIKDIHLKLLTGVKDNLAGRYRTIEVTVGDYLPPSFNTIPTLMQEFINWLNSPEPPFNSPLIYAGILHYRFVAIHPFEDGNGRTTRILTTLYLMKNGYDITDTFALDSYYNREPKEYYAALASVDQQRSEEGEPDLTYWLEYFTTGILTEAVRAQSNVTELLQKHITQPIHLSSTQKLLLKISNQNQTTQMSDYLKAVSLSQRGIFKALQQLIKGNLIKQHGELKGTYYTITDLGKQNLPK